MEKETTLTPEQRAIMEYLLQCSNTRRKRSKLLRAKLEEEFERRKKLFELPPLPDWQPRKEYGC